MIVGVAAVALVAAGIAVAPAFGATEMPARVARRSTAASGSFTPAAADPRLAALFARGGFDDSGFRFTPTGKRNNDRAVTVAVRARSVRSATDAGRLATVAAAAPTVGIAPIAYNLGVSVGWQRFALSSDVTRVDLASQPGGRDRVDVGVSYAGNRFTGRVKAAADRAVPGAPQVTDDLRSYALDVGGSYSLTRNVDVTAGLRYRSERDRLPRTAEERRDSQAVYLGTAFRF